MCSLTKLYALGLVLILALSACGGTPSDKSLGADAAVNKFRVAIVISGRVDALGWNNIGFAGLKLLEDELEAEVDYVEIPEGLTSQDAPFQDAATNAFRRFAADGYDFIVGHGGEFVATAQAVAKEFPRSIFAVIAGHGSNNVNLGTLAFRADEMGYLLGVVSALKSNTNKIAYIGGQDLPVMKELAGAFGHGANVTNPSIEVSTHWLANWNDPDGAVKVGRELIQAGYDVLVVNAGGADQAIFELAQAEGVYAKGSGSDRHDAAPDAIVTSAVLRVPRLLFEGATLARLGHWEGRNYTFGLRQNAQDLAPFYGMLTPAQEEVIDSVRAKLMRGEIDASP